MRVALPIALLCVSTSTGSFVAPVSTPWVRVVTLNTLPHAVLPCPAFAIFITPNLSAPEDVLFAYLAPKCQGNTSGPTPFLVWSSGGPGCSGSLANFAELGPSLMGGNGTLHANPNSWSGLAHVLFVDAPLGVGFSTGGARAANTSATYADLVSASLARFFDAASALGAAPLVLAGESYAGRWVPELAKRLQPSLVLIGNGWMAPPQQWAALPRYARAHSPSPLTVNESVLEADVGACDAAQRAGGANASALLAACGGALDDLMGWNPNVDPTNIRKPCPNYSCFDKPEWDALTAYLNTAEARDALGVPAATPQFALCSDAIGAPGVYDADRVESSVPALGELLGRPATRLVLYAGADDLVCDEGGVRDTALALQWDGAAAFAAAAERRWTAGARVKAAGRLAFVSVDRAGHQVPADAGATAVAMLSEALSGFWT